MSPPAVPTSFVIDSNNDVVLHDNNRADSSHERFDLQKGLKQEAVELCEVTTCCSNGSSVATAEPSSLTDSNPNDIADTQTIASQMTTTMPIPMLQCQNKVLKVCVLQSDPNGCAYEDDDSPADVASHFVRAGYSVNGTKNNENNNNNNNRIQQICIDNVYVTSQNYATTLLRLSNNLCSSTNNTDTGEIANEQQPYDCFINLCDGAWDEPSVGIEIVDLLENKLRLPFTGAGVEFYEPTRLDMKKAALAVGVHVPLWRFVYNAAELDALIHEFTSNSTEPPLKFPLLCKHFSSYSSVGLIKDSKVWDIENLKLQCTRMLETYSGCLIEEFIIGREYTVLASQYVTADGKIDVMAYEPVECKFAPGEDFKHYNLKWIDYENGISWHNVQDQELATRLKESAISVFKSINGRGYGRIDVRSDPSGKELYFLEINPNCGAFYPSGLYGSADFILDQFDSVSGHANFALTQIQVAKKLWEISNVSKRLFESRYNSKTKSWGLYALRNIEVNETIQYNEEQAIHVVSKSHILRTWSGVPYDLKGNMVGPIHGRTMGVSSVNNTYDNFRSYCWPISDNLFAMWNPKPSDWHPINHSCNPNAWLEGLDIIARYPIQKDEEICIDYATFCGYFPEMKSFTCNCRAKECRQVITGLDIITYPALVERYANHMSDYVASKAKEMVAAAELEVK